MDNFDKKLFTMAESEPVDAPANLNARVHSALEGISGRGVPRVGRTARMALCALAAAMVLAGTALAVSGGLRLTVERSGSGDTEGLMRAEMAEALDAGDLSEAVRDVARTGDGAGVLSRYADGSGVLAVGFESFREAEDFLGLALLGQNDLLDAARPGTHHSFDGDGKEAARGQCVVEITHNGSGDIEKLRADGVFCLTGEFDGVSVLARIAAATRLGEGGAPMGYLLPEDQLEEAVPEAYTAANGDEWTVVPRGDSLDAFRAEGAVLADLSVMTAGDTDAARTALYAVLDSFG